MSQALTPQQRGRIVRAHMENSHSTLSDPRGQRDDRPAKRTRVTLACKRCKTRKQKVNPIKQYLDIGMAVSDTSCSQSVTECTQHAPNAVD